MPDPKKKVCTAINNLFSLDLRGLAIFRICLAILILSDLAVRALSLRAHYTDFGVLPRGPLIEQFMLPWRISIHLMSGTLAVQIVLFLLAAFFAFMLLLGYRTKLATCASWFMMISLQARNPMILQAGDVLFRMLLFWGMFLPLGARFSLDTLSKAQAQGSSSKISNMATAAYGLQVCFVYWFTAIMKLKANSFPAWWKDGTAVYNALNVDQFTRPFGYWILTLPFPLLKFLSRSVICLEVLGPFLFFSPVLNPICRLAGVLSFWFFHFMLGISLKLGPFPFMSSLSVLPFLPSFFWDKIFPKTAAAAQIKEDLNSETKKTCLTSSFISNTLALFFLVYVLFTNIGAADFKYGLPKKMEWLGIMLGLDQRWNMFSPPLKDDGWYVIPGKLRSGKLVDVFRGGAEVSWEKPKSVAALYEHERWRKYMMNLWQAVNVKHRLYYGKYLCRNWNNRHPKEEQLMEFEIFFMREDTLPYGQKSTPQKVSTWKHYCFEVPADFKKSSSEK